MKAQAIRFLSSLRACLPHGISSRPRLDVRIEDDAARISIARRGVERLLGSARIDDRERLASLLKQCPKTAEPVLELPATHLLRRRVFLPVQAEAHLPRALDYEIDRLTPFQRRDVFLAWRPAPPHPPGRLGLEIALLPRAKAAPWVEVLASLGWPVARLRAQGLWPGTDLLAGAGRRRPFPWFDLGLWGGVFLLALAVLALPLWQERQVVIALGQAVARLRPEAARVAELERRLDARSRARRDVLRLKTRTPPVLDLLEALSEAVPADAWVRRFEYRDGRVTLDGEARRASLLAETLARQPAFTGLRFRSPVTPVPHSDRERFKLELQVRPVDGDRKARP